MQRKSCSGPIVLLIAVLLLCGGIPGVGQAVATGAASSYKVTANIVTKNCSWFDFNIQQQDTIPLDVRFMLSQREGPDFQVWRDGQMQQGTQYPPVVENRNHRHDYLPGNGREWKLIVVGPDGEQTVQSGSLGGIVTADMTTTQPGVGGQTTATFHNSDPVCSADVGNSSFKVTERPNPPSDSWIRSQQLYRTASGVVPPGGELSLTVENPPCAFQTDAHLGLTPATPPLFGDRLLKSVADLTSPPLCQNSGASYSIYLPWITQQVVPPTPACLTLKDVGFGWSRQNDVMPTTWYAVGEPYPTQAPGVNLWLVLPARPDNTSYYVVATEFQPATAGKPIENWGEIYPGTGTTGFFNEIHRGIPPGYVHFTIFFRSGGHDCEIGQFRVKVDDNAPAITEGTMITDTFNR